ncbi:MAG: thermonuclease family protein [Verrucomicrobiota bacterium]
MVRVIDGDTITLLNADKVEVKIRLNGIDAPESNQAFGAKSKAALSALIFGKAVIVHRRGRTVTDERLAGLKWRATT